MHEELFPVVIFFFIPSIQEDRVINRDCTPINHSVFLALKNV